MKRTDFGGGGILGLILVALVALFSSIFRGPVFLKDGGLWLRMRGRVRGFFLSWPIIRVPLILGGVDSAGNSEAMPAQGTYLMLEMSGSPGSPTVMEEIEEVTNIKPGGGTSEDIDRTHLRSPGRRREWMASFIDDGTLDFTIQYIPTAPTHQRIVALFESGELAAIRLVFPDASGIDYTGYCKVFNPDPIAVGGKITTSVSFKLTGATDFSGTGSPA